MQKNTTDQKGFFEAKAEEIVDRMERTSGRKLIVVILILISFSVVTLGLLQIKFQLDQPFFAEKLVEDKADIRGPIEFFNYFQEQQKNNEALVRLQQQDADSDSITDYQEIYIYRTNPYSPDSDGDGLSDTQELELQSDPNCPAGEVCDQEGFIVGGEEPLSSPDAKPVALTPEEAQLLIESTEESSGKLAQLTAEEKQALAVYFESLTLQDLKNLLIEQGYPADQLDGLTEDIMLEVLNNILQTF